MNENEEYIKIYSNELCKRWINETVRFYPTSMNVLQSHIIEAESLFDIVIVKDEITSLDIPEVQYSILLRSIK